MGSQMNYRNVSMSVWLAGDVVIFAHTRHIWTPVLKSVLKTVCSIVHTDWGLKKCYVSRFPDRLSKKNAPTVIFFFFCTWRKKQNKKKTCDRPLTIPFFIYVCYIICPYQFSDIVSLHRLLIYFQYGCTLTSQTEHISGLFRSMQPHLGLK